MRRSLDISFNTLACTPRSHTMPPYADIYVLAKSRTEAAVVEFLDYFAPRREQSAIDYSIPQHQDPPQQVFQTASEVVTYCCQHSTETQSIYWQRVGDGEPEHVMVFFTSDAHLIFGLSASENLANQFFAELQRHAHSDIGYITFESPPPGTAVEFRQLAHRASAKLLLLPHRLMNLAQDIVEQLRHDFPSDQIDSRLTQLAEASNTPRIQRCIVFAARGHAWYFDYLCKIDYRDVIIAAEYDRLGAHLYDFNKPIAEARIDDPYGSVKAT